MRNNSKKRVICVTGYSAVCPEGAFRAVVLSDLHNQRFDDVLEKVRDLKPDALLLPGDICEKMLESDFDSDIKSNTVENHVGLRFMKELSAIAPTYYVFGNHEIVGCKPRSQKDRVLMSRIAQLISERCGVRVLEDSYAIFPLPSGGRVYIGGLTSGYMNESFEPNLEFLEKFADLPGYKVLISHHPEYFPRYISRKNINLSLSGHAHGGQIRIFGRGLFAPGQGVLPKYTSGAHTATRKLSRGERITEPAMIVSRGLANNAPIYIPRLGNPIEIVVIDFARGDN